MVRMKDLCLELCRDSLNSSGLDGEDFITNSYQKEDERITLEVSNGNYDIIFSLASKEKKNGSFDDTFFHFEVEGHVTYIENIIVKGYHCLKFEELDRKQLLSVFENLAHHHSKIINKRNTQITNEQKSDVFLHEVNEEALEKLYEIASSVENEIIDIQVFKEGVNQLIGSSKEVLQGDNGHFYIDGGILQRKYFSKDQECHLFNLQKGRHVSSVYDMLSLLYLLTDQRKREKYFHDIIDHYYENLSDLSVDLPLQTYEKGIKTFIPYVKLDLVCFYIKQQNEETKSCKKLIYELIFELHEHILSPRINREDCYKIVRDAMGTNYENLNYEVAETEGLLGLLGKYCKIKITVTQSNKDKVFRLFAKFVPIELPHLNLVFLKEQFFYTTFLPELKRVGLEDIIDFLPKCYFTRSLDVIVFEDLSHSNYRPVRCDELFSYEMLQSAVKKIAKMHCCSLLYEEIMTKESGKETRINEKFDEYVKESVYVKDNKFIETFNHCGINSTVNYVFDQFADIPKEISMGTFKERTRKLFDLMLDTLESSEKYRNVICHGDVWGGNILFKFDDTKTSDCRFIDYQLIRYCPPAHDLQAFFYINTDKETRIRYMSCLIDQYYDELSTLFKRYNLDLNRIYSYDHFIDCCNYMKPQAICLAALMYPLSLDREKVQNLLLVPEKMMEFMTVDKSDVLQELMKDDRVRARYREIVEDLYDMCLEYDFK